VIPFGSVARGLYDSISLHTTRALRIGTTDMVDTLGKYFGSRHWQRQLPVRSAIWHAMGRVGLTGMHALPLSRRWIDIQRRDMPLTGLDPALAGLRLVHLSDIHYSPVVFRRYLEQYVEIVNRLSPDLCVITGDLITGGYRYAARVAKILRRINAPLGVVCTFGNHDYSMWGKRSPKQAHKRGDYLEAAIEGEGVVVLRNEVYRVTPDSARQYHPEEAPPPSTSALTLVGLDDEWTGKIDPRLAFSNVRPHEPTVCLNHNPVNARELLEFPWQWMLAGHTHGRQLGHKGWSKAILGTKRKRHFTHGYYALEGRHLYVNRGLAYGQRAHHWCKPEVTLFRVAAQ
jgi:uncharacterized protein